MPVPSAASDSPVDAALARLKPVPSMSMTSLHSDMTASPSVVRPLVRAVTIGLTAFLTLIDLFATQALLPMLAQAYEVSPAAMGVAVNACTFGMAVASLVVAIASRRIERRRGIWISLALLSIPTALLAVAPDLAVFAALRVIQGIFMAAAFALMLAYLGEHFTARSSAGAFAAYVTGNVASNLFGRLLASAMADHLGLSGAFILFAALNLAGAVLVYLTVARPLPMAMPVNDRPDYELDRPAAEPHLAGEFRNRVLHPVRLHRHLHLRQLRSGVAAVRTRHDVARPRLLRVSALDRHDAAGRTCRPAVRHAAGAVERARGRRTSACR